MNYIPGTWIREKILLLKSYFSGVFSDIVPIEIRTKHGFRTRSENIFSIHFPSSLEDFERSRQELAYEELFQFQKRGLEKKYALERDSLGLAPELTIDVELMKSLITSLPFPLTNKQRIVLFQILKDMERPHAMARMLQ